MMDRESKVARIWAALASEWDKATDQRIEVYMDSARSFGWALDKAGIEWGLVEAQSLHDGVLSHRDKD